MRIILSGMILAALFSCRKMKNVGNSNNFEGTWNWVSTTQDSTFYEDTATSTNTQHIHVMADKAMEWMRNDTTFFQGGYNFVNKQVSEATGMNERLIRLSSNPQQEFVIRISTGIADTLWLQEEQTGGKIYKYLRN